MEINEENQKKCVKVVGEIKKILELHNFEVVTDNSAKPYRERKNSISGEMLWFYSKASKNWPQSTDAKNRTGYCLFLRADEVFEFQLRCGISKIGYEKFDAVKFQEVMDNLNEICDNQGWKIDKSVTNSLKEGPGNSKEGMHVIIASEYFDSTSFDHFVEQLDIWNKNNIESFNKYKDLVKTKTATEIIMAEKLNEIKELLLNNHNIILHGAPGTGKTYLAKEIAKSLVFGDCKEKLSDEEQKQFNEQCGFIQFHQSYDYTDFVEGLRPKNDRDGKIGFEPKDGIFKRFCINALKNLVDSNKNEEEFEKESAWSEKCNAFLEEYYSDGDEDDKILETESRKSKFYISDYDDDSILIAIPKNEKKASLKLNRRDLLNALKKGDQWDSVEKMKEAIGRKIHHEAYYLFAIANKISSMGKSTNTSNTKPLKGKYIFIIDEINRGEMSKIFGELFFSIDPGYRVSYDELKKTKENSECLTTVQTQYANLQETNNDFDRELGISDDEKDNHGHFFVPENVYIIGTMNDIDRSVESMDFAMRRRFAFKEVTAEQSQAMFDNGTKWNNGKGEEIDVSSQLDNIKQRMNNLNNAILNKDFNLNSSYQIGGAYFLKFANYCKTDGDKVVDGDQTDAFNSLWTNHLQCILREYLRGMDNVDGDDGLLKKLEKAYNLDPEYKYNEKGEKEPKT